MSVTLSLRWRLLGNLLPTLLALIVASAVAAYFIALHVATLAYDRALLDPALAMAEHLHWSEGHLQFDLPKVAQQVLLVDTDDKMFFQISDADGRFLAGDPGLPKPGAVGQSLGRHAVFYDARFNGVPVRVAALPIVVADAPKGHAAALVQSAETEVKRDRLISEVLLGELLPNILVTIATIGTIWFGVRRGLAPLNRLRQEISARSHRDLRTVPEDRSPDETRPLIDAINDLLRRLQSAIGMQQRFIANAAHQLRTPLAGMLTQAELLERTDLPPAQQHQMVQLHGAIERTAHLANQLLTLARAEPGEYNKEAMKPLELSEMAESMVQEWVWRAHAKKIDLGFELDSARVTGDAFLLRELIANLLDNAIKYTPAEGTVTLRTGGGDQAMLEVEDSGIGIPENARERVLERFHRVDGSPGEGSGLGLAIVREIAETHGAEIELATAANGRGTRVRLRWREG